MKVICENVVSGTDTVLYKAVAPTNYSFDPQRFVSVTRGKFKNGVWESGDDNNSEKLYIKFKDICHNDLNII
jgi:hypothetical protein